MAKRKSQNLRKIMVMLRARAHRNAKAWHINSNHKSEDDECRTCLTLPCVTGLSLPAPTPPKVL